MPPHNSWKLCPSHCSCARCQNAIRSWKNKAQKHAANAKALKFVLMCMAGAEPEDHIRTEENGQIGVLPTLEEAQGELKSKCGVCKQNYTCRGERNMCAFTCSHTVCLECITAIKAINTSDQHKCPYCRDPIKKVIILRYDPPEEDEDDDDDDVPIQIPSRA